MADNLDWRAFDAAVTNARFFYNTSPQQVAARIEDAEVVVTNKVVLDKTAIDEADNLKLICVAATGVNNIDLEAATARGIPVINVTGYATPAVSQHVLALMLALATRWADYHRDVMAGAWERSEFFCRLDYPIDELAGKTLSIVGYGDLGEAVAKRARAFEMQLLIAERPDASYVRKGRVSFDEALEAADYMTLHCPLNDATRHLINADTLARMKPNAFLINTARGPLIDSYALIDALKNGQIGGAAIDVLDQEPPRDGHPLIDARLPNLIITPHMAWGSRAARQRMLNGVAANIRAFIAGDDSGRVN